MTAVALSEVRKSFSGQDVITGIDLQIQAGEFIVLVGPSGCGKSTLLRMIAGLEDITSGTIAIDGDVVNDLPPKARDIAMVFQSYALYPHMTVFNNIAFSLRLKRRPRTEIASAVARAAQILELDGLLDRYPKQLSGGQRQRVAMGRAIVRNPRVFLFDEPLSNLDAQLRVQMRAEIKQLHQQLGITTIYVTHDQIEAMTLADRIVVMRKGAVEQSGPPTELYDRPATTFVAGFIGSPSMNLLAARLVPDGAAGGFQAVLPGGTRLPVALRPEPAGGPPGRPLGDTLPGDVLLGVRPTDLERVADPQASADVIAGPVTLIEPTGAETLLRLDAHGQAVTALLRERCPLRVGQICALRPRAGAAHVFDAKRGQRLGP